MLLEDIPNENVPNNFSLFLLPNELSSKYEFDLFYSISKREDLASQAKDLIEVVANAEEYEQHFAFRCADTIAKNYVTLCRKDEENPFKQFILEELKFLPSPINTRILLSLRFFEFINDWK